MHFENRGEMDELGRVGVVLSSMGRCLKIKPGKYSTASEFETWRGQLLSHIC